MFAADALGRGDRRRAGRLVTSPEPSRPTLLALVDGARASLALETEELTDPAIVGALLGARARGVGGDAGLARAAARRRRAFTRWRRPARPSGPWPRRRSTARSSSPTGARSTSGRRTSPPPRWTTTASSACGWTTATAAEVAAIVADDAARGVAAVAPDRSSARGMMATWNPPCPPDRGSAGLPGGADPAAEARRADRRRVGEGRARAGAARAGRDAWPRPSATCAGW